MIRRFTVLTSSKWEMLSQKYRNSKKLDWSQQQKLLFFFIASTFVILLTVSTTVSAVFFRGVMWRCSDLWCISRLVLGWSQVLSVGKTTASGLQPLDGSHPGGGLGRGPSSDRSQTAGYASVVLIPKCETAGTLPHPGLFYFLYFFILFM